MAQLVPPLARGRSPVTPEVRGNPVTFVMTPLAGVPSAGVTSTGDVSVLLVNVSVEINVGIAELVELLLINSRR